MHNINMTSKLSILVIDDEAPLGDVYKGFFAKIGATVTFCDHPQKGWLAIDKEKYDLIITDLKMPIITGEELISIIRASKYNSHTPIILCSAHINKVVFTEVSRESKIYFLTKPFDSKALLELVAKAVVVNKIESIDNLSFNEKWLQSFSHKLSSIMGEEATYTNIEQFELWNFEAISLSLFVIKDNEYLNVNLLLKLKTFLKIAGKIQGTQYKEIESETLQVWQDLMESIFASKVRITFLKLLSSEIITSPGQKSGFYKISTTAGEIQVFLN